MMPLPPQLLPSHPAIAASHARHQMAMDQIRRSTRPVPVLPAADTRTLCQREADESALLRAQDQAIDLVTGDGPGEPS
jgi:hypothetical protein